MNMNSSPVPSSPPSMRSSSSESATSSDNTSTCHKRSFPDEELTSSGRSKRHCADALVGEGRHLARTRDAFMLPSAMINSAVIRIADKADEPDSAFSAEANRWYKIYNYLVEQVHGFGTRIENASDAEFKDITTNIKKGLSAARSDDVSTLKGAVYDWLVEEPYSASTTMHPLKRNSKATRGYHNPVTGKLLCPLGYDWNDENIKRQLQEGTLEMSAGDWPAFFYPDDHVADADPFVGFMRHPLLVKTFKHIFTSPSSVVTGDGPRATRASKAQLHNMTEVTVASLAYTAMQLRHALSSDTIFQQTATSKNFGFYYGVLEILEDPAAAPEVTTLLEWWKGQVFPSHTNTPQAPATSALARMRAHLGH